MSRDFGRREVLTSIRALDNASGNRQMLKRYCGPERQKLLLARRELRE